MFIKATYTFCCSLLILFAACNGGDQQGISTSDSASTATVDSMPVVNPGTADSSAVIQTPGTNDDNVIVPDSTRRTIPK